MTFPAPTALVLAWQPEIADFREAFRAKDRIRRVPEIFGATVAMGVILGFAGMWADQPMMVGAAAALVLMPAYLAGPGYRMLVRSIWRQLPTLRQPVEVRVDRETGLTTTVPGSTGQYSWSFWEGFLETERVFVLLAGRRKGATFMVVAKRGLSSPHEVSLLRDILCHETGGVMPKAWTRSRR